MRCTRTKSKKMLKNYLPITRIKMFFKIQTEIINLCIIICNYINLANSLTNNINAYFVIQRYKYFRDISLLTFILLILSIL